MFDHESSKGSGLKSRRRWSLANVDLVINNILVISLVLIATYFSFSTSAFLTISNFEVILTNDAAIGVLVAFIHSSRDRRSCRSLCRLQHRVFGILVGLANTKWGMTNSTSILMGLGCGAAIGAINGALCGLLRLNSIIVTLGMLSALRGVILLIEPTDVYGLGPTFNVIGNGSLFGVPILILLVAVSFVISAAFISFTVWGRHIYAIGINPQAAFLAALPG